MNRTATSIISLAFALSAGSAIAAGPVNNETGEGLFPASVSSVAAKSRDQVRAELADAVRNGDVIANNATGETVRAAAPSRVISSAEAQRTRDQVKAELAEAVRKGSLIANNATGETFSERYAHVDSRSDAS